MSLLGFGNMFANFHVCRMMLYMLVSLRRPMCFRCLMFNLSGPVGLLFLKCFIASWT